VLPDFGFWPDFPSGNPTGGSICALRPCRKADACSVAAFWINIDG